jgi:nitrogen fixation-related uncharacterized protein
MTTHGALLILWGTFTGLALIAVAAVLVWAVRSHQFAEQDRARYLPLRSRIPRPNEPES